MISQGEAKAKALAIDSRSDRGLALTLSNMMFDEANGLWEIHFRTDGRIAMAPRSHPAEHFTSDDPVQQRKERTSWFSVATEVHLFLDGRTGEVRGGGFAGGKPDLSRSDLEHYRGRILVGGETVRLRLINADDSREGRDLLIDIPQSILTDSGLALWHLEYGTGHRLDVWGLTGPGSRVVAYRLSLPRTPGEELLAFRLVQGVPVYPDALDRAGTEDRRVLLARGATVDTALEWYRNHMPVYGWRQKAMVDASGNLAQFEHVAGVVVQVEAAAVPEGVEIVLTWPEN